MAGVYHRAAVTFCARRRLCDSCTEAVEPAPTDSPHFRVPGKIFASLGDPASFGVPKAEPDVFPLIRSVVLRLN
jgi:hypothetical protein